MTVEREVQLLETQCEQMEEAIALLRTPQKYEPAPGQNDKSWMASSIN